MYYLICCDNKNVIFALYTWLVKSISFFMKSFCMLCSLLVLYYYIGFIALKILKNNSKNNSEIAVIEKVTDQLNIYLCF